MFTDDIQYRLSNGRGEYIYTLSADALIQYVWQPTPQVDLVVTETTPVMSAVSVVEEAALVMELVG
jgi:hypothetical protein